MIRTWTKAAILGLAMTTAAVSYAEAQGVLTIGRREDGTTFDPIATAQVEELIDELRASFSVVIVPHSPTFSTFWYGWTMPARNWFPALRKAGRCRPTR